MADEVDPIEAAFQRASKALDDAWQLHRETKSLFALRIDTATHSLADPNGVEIAAFLLKAAHIAVTPDERHVLRAIARSCNDDGLISETAHARILKEVLR